MFLETKIWLLAGTNQGPYTNSDSHRKSRSPRGWV